MPHQEATASRLTNSQVGVDRGITGCASQILVFPVRDVLVGPGVSVLLGQTKINDVYEVALFAKAHKEVVWLHIPMDEVFGMNVLNTADLEED